MIQDQTTRPPFAGRQAAAAFSYFIVVGGLAALSIWFVLDYIDRYHSLTDTSLLVAQLDSRRAPGQTANNASEIQEASSPFIKGQSITVAGASLQQRVDYAVEKNGGVVASSQIVIDGPQAKDGFVSLTANIEIAQSGLQALLYDLEAGTPYLFIDSLAVQSPQAVGETENAQMRIVIGLSGQWRLGQ